MRAALLLVTFLAVSSPSRPEGREREEIICCGQDEVFIVDVAGSDPGRKVWSWKAAGRPDLPERLWSQFRSTDECKPVDGGKRILITSSSGGVALVERAGKRVKFYASVRNAHSAEILPEGRVAVAGSYGETGNRLVVYDLEKSDTPVFVDELYSGHGVVWDRRRERLWALGEKVLRAYRLKNWESGAPALERVKRFALPDRGGHDLRPVPGTDDLVVTTNEGVFLFDRKAERFRGYPGLEGASKVKSMDIHPRTGRLAYVQAEERWWAFRVRFRKPGGELQLPGERLYKARWNPGPGR